MSVVDITWNYHSLKFMVAKFFLDCQFLYVNFTKEKKEEYNIHNNLITKIHATKCKKR